MIDAASAVEPHSSDQIEARFELLACRPFNPVIRLRRRGQTRHLRLVRDGHIPPSAAVAFTWEDDLGDSGDTDHDDARMVVGHTVSFREPASSIDITEHWPVEDVYLPVVRETLETALHHQRCDSLSGRIGFAIVRPATTAPPETRIRFTPAPLRLDLPRRLFGEGLALVPMGTPGLDHPFGVVVEEAAFDVALERVRACPDHEVSLVPIGTRYLCPEQRRPWLLVDDFAFGAEGTETTVEVPASRIAELRKLLRSEGRARKIVGTFHSHVVGNLLDRRDQGPSDGNEPSTGEIAPLEMNERDHDPAPRTFFSSVDRTWFESHVNSVSAHIIADLHRGSVEMGIFGFDYGGDLARWSGFHLATGSTNRGGDR